MWVGKVRKDALVEGEADANVQRDGAGSSDGRGTGREGGDGGTGRQGRPLEAGLGTWCNRRLFNRGSDSLCLSFSVGPSGHREEER